MTAYIRRVLARFEWCMLGELIACASLFALLFGGLILGHGLGLK
jgi:hypothetical protein